MSRNKKIVWTAVVLAIVGGLTFIVHQRIVSQRGGPGFANPALRAGFAAPLSVGVARVTRGDVPITIDSLGTVTPLATVTVHPQVTGPLVKIAFTEGQMVRKGDVLAVIDPRPFQAAVDQAMGQLDHDQALLANARVDLDRYRMLMESNSVAEQTYATQQATVVQDQATVVADKAALESAKLNLSYCNITAPVDGSVGLRQVDLGNVVSAYSSTIAVVTQLHPMSVLFTIPEDDLSQVLGRLHKGDKLTAVAYDRTFTTRLDTGVLANSDNQVDPTTGTLKLRAMFSNAALELFPQQFVNVRLTLETLHDQLLVPGAAVQTGASGTYVYVVDTGNGAGSRAPSGGFTPADDPPGPSAPGAAASGGGRPHRGGGRAGGTRIGGAASFGGGGPRGPVHTVHIQYVSTGPTVGNLISIRSGLSVGQIVVVDGAEQLKDGARVTTPGLDQPGEAGQSAAAADAAAPAFASRSGQRAAAGYGYRTPGARGQWHPGAGRPGAGQPGPRSQSGGAPAGAPAAGAQAASQP